MDRRLKDIVDRLDGDVQSGAAELMNVVLDSILAVPDADIAAIPAGEWEDFAAAMHRIKPSIAPIFNIANSIMLLAEEGPAGLPRLHATLADMREREKRSGPLIAAGALRDIKGDWLMTTSYSSTVYKTLLALSEDRPIKVTVAESAPGKEGMQFAKLLSEHIECEVIYDSTVFARMADVDGAITGADSIAGSGLINKVGTRALTEAARAYQVPAYAVCGWNKVCPVELSDLVIKDDISGERLTEHVQIFESTPLELFRSIITDRGTMSPEKLNKKLKADGVAKGWYFRGILQPPAP